MKKLLASFALATLVAAPAWAATQTVTLAVPGMTKAEVSYENREAIVTFDDAKTNVQALTKATEDAGYPSSVKQ